MVTSVSCGSNPAIAEQTDPTSITVITNAEPPPVGTNEVTTAVPENTPTQPVDEKSETKSKNTIDTATCDSFL